MQTSFSATVELPNVGALEITGTTTCTKPSHTDSYEYEIETIGLVDGEENRDVYLFIQALFGEVYNCKAIDAACEAAMIMEWGCYELQEAA